MKRIVSYLTASVVVVMGAAVSSAATIDFTDSSNGSNVTNISQWVIQVDFDGSGAWSAEEGSTGPFSFGSTDGFSQSGDVAPGIAGSALITLDGFNTGGSNTSLRLNSGGLGLGVTGVNAGRIDWNPTSHANPERMVVNVNYSPDDPFAGFLVIKELTFVNLAGSADPQISGFDQSLFVNFPVGTTEATFAGNDNFKLTGPEGTRFLRIRDNAGSTGGGQGFSLASITFDIVPEPSTLALIAPAMLLVSVRRRK